MPEIASIKFWRGENLSKTCRFVPRVGRLILLSVGVPGLQTLEYFIKKGQLPLARDSCFDIKNTRLISEIVYKSFCTLSTWARWVATRCSCWATSPTYTMSISKHFLKNVASLF